MPEVTAKMTEKLRLAMSSDHFVTEDEMPALRRKAVEGVKRIINRRATNNAIMAEWIAAREEAKKWTHEMKNVTTEAAKLKAIETIVERHATETAKIMSSTEPTKLLRLALEDANTARALHAIDPNGLKAALVMVEAQDASTSEDAENLIATLKSLVDLGEIDAVVRALKNVTLGSIMKNTGVTTHAQAQAGKIRVGGNSSPVKFNGMSVKRKPSKLFNKVVNAPDREFNKLVTDHVNINKTAKSIMEAAMTRNTTKAAATINIPANRQPN